MTASSSCTNYKSVSFGIVSPSNILKTLKGTEGFGKTMKVVSAIFSYTSLSRIYPVLNTHLRGLTKITDIFEVVNLGNELIKDMSKLESVIGFISLIFQFIFKAGKAIQYLGKEVQLFDLKKIVGYIGALPVVGYIVLIPLEAISLIGLGFYTAVLIRERQRYKQEKQLYELVYQQWQAQEEVLISKNEINHKAFQDRYNQIVQLHKKIYKIDFTASIDRTLKSDEEQRVNSLRHLAARVDDCYLSKVVGKKGEATTENTIKACEVDTYVKNKIKFEMKNATIQCNLAIAKKTNSEMALIRNVVMAITNLAIIVKEVALIVFLPGAHFVRIVADIGGFATPLSGFVQVLIKNHHDVKDAKKTEFIVPKYFPSLKGFEKRHRARLKT